MSWDTEEEPTREQFEKLAHAYRYAQPSRETLIEDLVALARCGYNIWDVLIGQLSGGQDEDLIEKMKVPGRVEFANRQSLDLLVPAACLYDYPLNAYESQLTVCPSFLEALGVTPLAGIPCFNGRCPSYDDRRVVCPSGFWGFRHQIGYSASLTGGKPGDATDQALTVGARPGPVFTVGASADKALTQRDQHLQRLQTLGGDRWHFAWSRTDLFALFQHTTPSVVYLYGHGGMQGTSPYFEVGTGDDGPIIRSALRGIANWSTTHPLSFPERLPVRGAVTSDRLQLCHRVLADCACVGSDRHRDRRLREPRRHVRRRVPVPVRRQPQAARRGGPRITTRAARKGHSTGPCISGLRAS